MAIPPIIVIVYRDISGPSCFLCLTEGETYRRAQKLRSRPDGILVTHGLDGSGSRQKSPGWFRRWGCWWVWRPGVTGRGVAAWRLGWGSGTKRLQDEDGFSLRVRSIETPLPPLWPSTTITKTTRPTVRPSWSTSNGSPAGRQANSVAYRIAPPAAIGGWVMERCQAAPKPGPQPVTSAYACNLAGANVARGRRPLPIRSGNPGVIPPSRLWAGDPGRLTRRCLVVSPDDAGIGAVPLGLANAASFRLRP